MRRRSFVTAALGASLWPALARAQDAPAASALTIDPGGRVQPMAQDLIEPTTPLEFAFVQALNDERMRPIFRRYLLDTSVALALTGDDQHSAPLEVEVREGWRGAAIFTTAERLNAVLGPETPRILLNGRAALTRLEGKNAVINYRLMPMLTLDHDDVQEYLATEGSVSAGPTQ